MHPAPSVIVFTVASGAGLGFAFLLAACALAGALPGGLAFALAACTLAFVLIVGGLLASTLHLGHPERAWRALSQWRSSWLSREGIAAVACLLALALFAGAWLVAPGRVGAIWRADGAAALGALALLALAPLTVLSTAMIYASLKPVHAWCNGWVVPVYLANAAASGAALFLALARAFEAAESFLAVMTAFVLAAAFWIKRSHWAYCDRTRSRSTTSSATGLGPVGQVRLLEAPATETSYLMREMGFVVARKHATKLRRYALILGYAAPGACAILSLVFAGMPGTFFGGLGALLSLGGMLVERWLFFAEARHTVTLYYGSAHA